MICAILDKQNYIQQFSHGTSSVPGYINVENSPGYTDDELLYCKVVDGELQFDAQRYNALKAQSDVPYIPPSDNSELGELKAKIDTQSELILKQNELMQKQQVMLNALLRGFGLGGD